MLNIDICFFFLGHKGRQASLRKEKGTQPKGSKLNGGENLPFNFKVVSRTKIIMDLPHFHPKNP
jgi:hypothetical protein